MREEVAHLERTDVGLRGRDVVLLTSAGARTGLLRKTPLMASHAPRVPAVVASMAGSDRPRHRYADVLASPEVTFSDRAEVLRLVAREASGAEHSRWWSLDKSTQSTNRTEPFRRDVPKPGPPRTP